MCYRLLHSARWKRAFRNGKYVSPLTRWCHGHKRRKWTSGGMSNVTLFQSCTFYSGFAWRAKFTTVQKSRRPQPIFEVIHLRASLTRKTEIPFFLGKEFPEGVINVGLVSQCWCNFSGRWPSLCAKHSAQSGCTCPLDSRCHCWLIGGCDLHFLFLSNEEFWNQTKIKVPFARAVFTITVKKIVNVDCSKQSSCIYLKS